MIEETLNLLQGTIHTKKRCKSDGCLFLRIDLKTVIWCLISVKRRVLWALGNLVFTEQTTHISYCQKKSNSSISIRASVVWTNGLFSNLRSFLISWKQVRCLCPHTGGESLIYLHELGFRNCAEEFHTLSTEFNLSRTLPPLQTQSWLKKTG